jgi:hypothetical protein
MTQHKWLVMAICFCLGESTSFGGDSALQKWIKNMVNNDPRVKAAQTNANAYSKLINYSNDEVNKLVEQDAKNLDGSVPANNGDLTKEQAVAIHQQHLAALWKTQTNINTLISISQQCRDAALQDAVAHTGDSFDDRKARADAQGLINDYNNLVKWANNNGTRIRNATNDLRDKDTDSGTNYPDAPNEIDRAPLPALPKDSGADAGDHPWKDPSLKPAADAQDVIADLFGEGAGFGPGTTSVDQGDKNTQKFIDTLSGNNNGAGGDTSNQPNNGRDNAIDAGRDAAAAARDAATAARSATDGMRPTDNCPQPMRP